MDFRWAVGIALWTLLIGPVVGPPRPRTTEPQVAASSLAAEPDSSESSAMPAE